jgi:hypothetical protein
VVADTYGPEDGRNIIEMGRKASDLAKDGQGAEAIEIIKVMSEQTELPTRMLSNLAIYLGREGRWGEVVEIRRRIADRVPDNAINWINLANAQEEAGLITEAENTFRTNLDRFWVPGFVSNFSGFLFRTGRAGEAMEITKKMITKSGNIINRLDLVELQLENGDQIESEMLEKIGLELAKPHTSGELVRRWQDLRGKIGGGR